MYMEKTAKRHSILTIVNVKANKTHVVVRVGFFLFTFPGTFSGKKMVESRNLDFDI